MGSKELNAHRRAFLIGSILPDCRPSFLTTRHTISETFHLLKTEINGLTYDYDKEKDITAYYSIHLGIVMHYLADYFTFPHNTGYEGGVKNHIEYERELLIALQWYMEENPYIDPQRKLCTIDGFSDYILEQHIQYGNEEHDIITDCRYITTICTTIMDVVLNQKQMTLPEAMDGQVEAA